MAKGSISYRSRLPGGSFRVITYDDKYRKTVTIESPKKKKGKKK